MPVSVYEEIAAARHALVNAGFGPDDAALDAEVLAREVLGWDRARLLARGRETAPPEFTSRFQAAIGRRLNREPVAMITGHREFWGLDLIVTPATLVPRPETELIVAEALRLTPETDAPTIVDIGTGSGCLAVSLALERPLARVIATDVSFEALLVAKRNAYAHGVSGRVHLVQTDLASSLSVRADLIVSNPPYVRDQAAALMPKDVVGYEPYGALFGGPDGMDVIRRLLATTAGILLPGGRLILEFGFGQEDDVRGAAGDAGWRVHGVLHDLQGIARTVVLGR
jgi:release factor glutamine methyltransferase